MRGDGCSSCVDLVLTSPCVPGHVPANFLSSLPWFSSELGSETPWQLNWDTAAPCLVYEEPKETRERQAYQLFLWQPLKSVSFRWSIIFCLLNVLIKALGAGGKWGWGESTRQRGRERAGEGATGRVWLHNGIGEVKGPPGCWGLRSGQGWRRTFRGAGRGIKRIYGMQHRVASWQDRSSPCQQQGDVPAAHGVREHCWGWHGSPPAPGTAGWTGE